MPRVVHFEIGADDPERARAFYEDVFAWNFVKWGGIDDYWLVQTGSDEEPGINGGLFVRKGAAGHVNTIAVPEIDEYLEKVEASGGEVVTPKRALPGVGWLAYCRDTEGSVFGLMQTDPHAK